MPFTNAEITSAIACLYVRPTRCCIPLPGGGQLCVTGDDLDPWKLLQPYIMALMSTLNPFMPFFRALAVIQALVECIFAIPQSILPPNPQPIIDCFKKLGVALVQLLKLIPFISLPFTLLAIFDCIILFLTALQAKLGLILSRFTQLNISLSSPDPNIAFMAQCELDLLSIQIAVINDILTALAVLFGIVNLFLGLIGIQGIPTSLSIGTDPSGALEPLNDMITTLVTIRSFIPIG